MEADVGDSIEIEIDGEVELTSADIEQNRHLRVPSPSSLDACCRVCLGPADKDSLFEKGRHDKLSLCTGIQVKRDPWLPTGLCHACSDNLEVSFRFKATADRTYALLLCNQIQKKNSKPAKVRSTKNRNAIDVSGIQCLKDLNSFLFEPPPAARSNADLADKIQETLLSTTNARITLCNTIIKKAQDHLYPYSIEFEDDTDEAAPFPDDMLDENLPPASIKVHNFEKLVERRLLRDKRGIKIINGKEHEEEPANPSEYFVENVDLEEFFVANVQTTSDNNVIEGDDAANYINEVFIQDESVVQQEEIYEEEDSPCNYYTTTTRNTVRTQTPKFSQPRINTLPPTMSGADIHIEGGSGTRKIIFVKDNVVKRGSILKHVESAKEELICPSCGILTTNITAHMASHESGPHICMQCGKTYNQQCHYDAHMKRHSGIKDNVCEICGAAYLFAKSLMRHKLVHSGEKPFTCDKCPMRFYVKCDLTRHLKVHAGYKPFVCDICNMAFNAKHQLQNHTRLHTGEKPYTCQICDMAFTYKVNLNNHCLKVHHLNIKFKSIHKLDNVVMSKLLKEQNPQYLSPTNKPRRKGLLKSSNTSYDEYEDIKTS